MTRYWSSYPRDRTSRFFQFSWFGPLEEVPPGVGVNFGLEPFYDPVPDRAVQVESRLDQVAFVGNHTFREGGLRCPCTGADADSHAQIGQGGPDSLEECQLGLHRLGSTDEDYAYYLDHNGKQQIRSLARPLFECVLQQIHAVDNPTGD